MQVVCEQPIFYDDFYDSAHQCILPGSWKHIVEKITRGVRILFAMRLSSSKFEKSIYIVIYEISSVLQLQLVLINNCMFKLESCFLDLFPPIKPS